MLSTKDEKCKRSNIERRQFTYTYYVPERRSSADQRKSADQEYQNTEKLYEGRAA